MRGRTIRRGAAAAFWVALALSAPAHADTFTATYSELARSPAGYAASWYSGAVTKDNKFIYGMGHSHASYNNNGLWTYDPATDTHASVFSNTGGFWRWDKDAAGKLVHESGRWAKLDPVKDKALYEFFGGPDIVAMTNRNNHQAFYMPGVDQFWVMAGTAFSEASPYTYGRFDLKTRRWAYMSKPWGAKAKNDLVDFSAGMIAGKPAGWAAPNAATAVCMDLDTVVLFGGMSDKAGTVRIIEPNPAGPEHYRWANAPKAPIHLPAENVRHNAACVGDTVYFVTGQERLPNNPTLRTPDPAPFWKFHVPTRTWTELPPGPAGAYFTVMSYDAAAKALLVYGGSKSNRLWVYDLAAQRWQDLTGTVPELPYADMHTGGYLAGFGHIYKGGKRYDEAGKELSYTASSQMMKIVLKRVPGANPTVGTASAANPQTPETSPKTFAPEGAPTGPAPAAASQEPSDSLQTEPPARAAALDRDQSIVQRVKAREKAPRLGARPLPRAAKAHLAEPQSAPRSPVGAASAANPQIRQQPAPTFTPEGAPAPAPQPAALRITWTKIPLPGSPNSPQGSMKHQRLVEGPGGRVWLLGGDWGGAWGENSGRQEVYSFDPLTPTGDWRLEAPYCGKAPNPVHWHTDEAGVAWDAKRGVFWKLAGTEYGPDDACLAAGGSVKAKVIQFNPTTKLWTVPAGFSQMRFGYITNGLLDVAGDQMVQITDTKAFHLSLNTGKWSEYPLPPAQMRFNVYTAQIGRDVWWLNRGERMETYNLDTHKTTQHAVWPWPQIEGYATQMVFNWGGKVLIVSPASGPTEPRRAAIYDHATKQWTVLAQGDGWGNAGMLHSSGKLILMGGGIAGAEHHNRQVWVGTVAD